MRAPAIALLTLFLVATAGSAEPSRIPVADAFDFPVGNGGCEGYYKSRGFRSNGHMGDDWNGAGGGNTDYGAPVYAAGNGVVVYARDARHGWGNVVIVRHSFHEKKRVQYADSFYGHVAKMLVKEGQIVKRGQKIATIGTGNGRYGAHLHFEVRKNLAIGTNQSGFRRDTSNYYDPTSFIASHRTLKGTPGHIAFVSSEKAPAFAPASIANRPKVQAAKPLLPPAPILMTKSEPVRPSHHFSSTTSVKSITRTTQATEKTTGTAITPPSHSSSTTPETQARQLAFRNSVRYEPAN